MSGAADEFEGRCPFCRRRFTAFSPFAVNEILAAHVAEKHVGSEDAISWNDRKEDQ